MLTEELRRLLISGTRPKVLVAGDVILDKFIWGHVERISPEAPVQVVNIDRENIALGGAGNVANNLAAMGAEVLMLSVVGSDSAGEMIRAEFDRIGMSKEGLLIDVHRPTTEKTRIIAGSQQVARVDREITEPIDRDVEDKALDYFRKHLPELDVVIVSDYHKGLLTDRLLHSILDISKQARLKTIVDPKRSDFAVYSGADTIKPNAREAEIVVGRKLRTENDFLDAAREIRRRFSCENVLITRGKDGMLLVDPGGHHSIPSTAREVFDVTGAGDTVTAFFGMMLAMGADHLDAARLANVAAGIAVNRVGTVTVSRPEVLRELEKLTSGSTKILTVGELASILPALRSRKKVVFTNGCFDILHVGHVTLLRQARALGDYLVVGLNSDTSVRRIKGKNRPIVKENERAHLLAALEAVDFVVVFDEDTPRDVIRQIKPDILVKGADYRVEDVVGRDIVESYGGKVELVPLVDGLSTTHIVQTILAHHTGTGEDRN